MVCQYLMRQLCSSYLMLELFNAGDVNNAQLLFDQMSKLDRFSLYSSNVNTYSRRCTDTMQRRTKLRKPFSPKIKHIKTFILFLLLLLLLVSQVQQQPLFHFPALQCSYTAFINTIACSQRTVNLQVSVCKSFHLVFTT